jgi:hypothetical protein
MCPRTPAPSTVTEPGVPLWGHRHRHDRPADHGNEAYPFVRLHQPGGPYGTDSVPLPDSGAR